VCPDPAGIPDQWDASRPSCAFATGARRPAEQPLARSDRVRYGDYLPDNGHITAAQYGGHL